MPLVNAFFTLERRYFSIPTTRNTPDARYNTWANAYVSPPFHEIMETVQLKGTIHEIKCQCLQAIRSIISFATVGT
jgi:hypothetical protein